MRAQQYSRICGSGAFKGFFSATKRLNQLFLNRFGKPTQDVGYVRAGLLIERVKNRPPFCSQSKLNIPGIEFRALSRDQPGACKAVQNPAEIAGIESKILADFPGSAILSLRQFE